MIPLSRLLSIKAQSPTRALGRRGERAAARYLKRRGYAILKRNLTSRIGEIDILAATPDDTTLVIVEVKARTLANPDAQTPYNRRPERNITAHKRRKLLALAHSLQREPRFQDTPLRIDVVAVEFPPKGKPNIRHHPAAIKA